MKPAELLARVLRSSGTFTPPARDDARRIVEIACLAVVSDGRIAREELAVIRELPDALESSLTMPPADIDALVATCMKLPTRDAQVERLREVAAGLGSEAVRQIAYAVSLVTALADNESADREFEFDLDLQDALDLAPADAERLSEKARAATERE